MACLKITLANIGQSFYPPEQATSSMNMTMADIMAERQRWYDTSFLRADGRVEYREKKEFGSRHAVFDSGSCVGDMHVDRFNATDVPVGTVRHAGNYVEEKTGIPEPLASIGMVLAGIAGIAYIGYRALKD